MRITYVYKNVSHLSSDKEPEYHFILQVFFRYGCPSQLLTAGPLKIHGNVWKTEAEDESSDRILKSVSRGLTKDIRLKWCQSTCHGSKAVQHEGCQSRSSDTVTTQRCDGRHYKICHIYLLSSLIPLLCLPKSPMLFLTKMHKIEQNDINYNHLRKMKKEIQELGHK